MRVNALKYFTNDIIRHMIIHNTQKHCNYDGVSASELCTRRLYILQATGLSDLSTEVQKSISVTVVATQQDAAKILT